MNQKLFNIGDKKTFNHTVGKADIAEFATGVVHTVYATFAVARDAEWVCRLFVIDMKDDTEEGIGTCVHVKHHAPAKLGAIVNFEASLVSINGNEIICSFEASSEGRLIASGETGQKIISKEKLAKVFSSLS